jgi:hypothetical protein
MLAYIYKFKSEAEGNGKVTKSSREYAEESRLSDISMNESNSSIDR